MAFRTLPVRSGGNSDNNSLHPWQVTIKNFGNKEAPQWKFIVNKASRLTKSLKYNDEVIVTGKASVNDPKDNDSGWTGFSLSGAFAQGLKVWIELEYNNDPTKWPEIIKSSIQYDGSQNSWDGGEAEYINANTSDDPIYLQSVMRHLLAIIWNPKGDGNYQVDQWTTTHLYLALTGGDSYNDSGGDVQSTPQRMAYPVA